MSIIARPASTVAAACLIALLTACGDGGSTASDESFCDSMETAVGLLAPGSGSTTPQGTRARYAELETVLDAAQTNAPTSIASDVATFASAIDDYAAALAGVDHDLDALFRTPGGVHLGEDTSHALTPAIIEHLNGPCGLALE